MSLCKECISGVRHGGTPEGKIEKIDGVDCYIATPTVDYPKDKVVLFLTDVFGIPLTNNKLLADDFAKNGFKTIIPDYFSGDPVPEDALSGKTAFNREEWFAKHGASNIRPPLDKVIASLKEEGVTTFAAAGYCLGGRYAFDLGIENIAKVTMIAHPGGIKIPEDLETYAASSKAPLLVNACEIDQHFALDSKLKADEIFGDGKFKPGYEGLYWEGCSHGFAVRGDMSDPKVKIGKEGAFKATVEFFLKYL